MPTLEADTRPTAAALTGHPEFVQFCRGWQDAGRCPAPFTDWLQEHELHGQSEGARWAAEGYDGTGGRPVAPVFTPHGWRWNEQSLPAAVAAIPAGPNWPTFADAAAALLDAWAVSGLSWEQMQAARHLLRNVGSKPVQTLGGYAGTGKTQLLSHLYAELPRFATCAFTGKAADILKRKGLPGATIHGTIYRPVERERGKVEFVLKSKHELSCDGFLVDEASMVGTAILDDLMSFGLPVIAVGDHGQLPPVGDDAGLMAAPDVTLETVHRSAGPIARFAEHLRKGGGARDWEAGDGVYVVAPGRVTDALLLRADQIICAFNRTRVGLNRRVRKLRGRALFDTDRPEPGDRVMCTRNDRVTGVFNGMQGTAAEIDNAARYMRFRPDHGPALDVFFDPDGWNREKKDRDDTRRPIPGVDVPFDFAYCITAHKSQGDEWDKVMVFEQRCRLWEHARWAYTAASRARKGLLWVAEDGR